MKAAMIARALGGHRTGATWMARCPAHDDRTPSLALRDGREGRVLVCCHAGCSQGEVIAALRGLGLWHRSNEPGPTCGANVSAVARATRMMASEAGDEGRTAAARALWRSTIAAAETPVEAYLTARGLTLRPPATLRFHPAIRHPSGGMWPAMIALVTTGKENEPVSIHRTFLARGGSGKASVVPQKMMLGPCRGGAVRLGEPDGGSLLVGEGIETCLAAMQATSRPAWAALSTSGIRSLELPETITEVVLLADGDDPGEAAARHAAHRWSREGRSVRIARAPAGQDFNDLLVAGVVNRPEATP